MAEVDKLLNMMVQKNVSRAILTNDRPMHLYVGGNELSGSTVSKAALHRVLQEVLPQHLHPQLTQDGNFHYEYASPVGMFVIGVASVLGNLQCTIVAQPKPATVPSSVPPPAPINPTLPRTQSHPGGNASLSYASTQTTPSSNSGMTQLFARQVHKGLVNVVTFSPDGKYVASAGVDDTVCLWDSQTGSGRRSFKAGGGAVFDNPVYAMVFSPNGKELYCAASSGLMICDLFPDIPSAKAMRKTLILHGAHSGTAMTCSKDNRTVIIGTRKGPGTLAAARPNATLQVMESETKKTLFFNPITWGIDDVSLSSDGTLIACIEVGNLISLFSTQPETTQGSSKASRVGSLLTKTVVFGSPKANFLHKFKLSEPQVRSIAFLSDNERLVIGTDEEVSVWNVMTQKIIWVKQQGLSGRHIAVSPDGKVIACGKERAMCLLDAQQGSILCTVDTTDSISSVAFSSDGKHLVCGTYSGTMQVWRLT